MHKLKATQEPTRTQRKSKSLDFTPRRCAADCDDERDCLTATDELATERSAAPPVA